MSSKTIHPVDSFGPGVSEEEKIEVVTVGHLWFGILATREGRVETCTMGRLIRKLSFGSNSVFSLMIVKAGM